VNPNHWNLCSFFSADHAGRGRDDCGEDQSARPDIVWIGLGAAKEEYWSESHVGKIVAPVLIAVGAAFDFHSGRKAHAPAG